MKILVRAPNWLGDSVMALPCLKALKEAFPEAELLLGCREHLVDFFKACSAVDRIISCSGEGPFLSQLLGPVEKIRADIGILLTNSFSTALWMWRTGTRKRFGYNRDGRRLFLTTPITVTPKLAAAHMTDYYLNIAVEAGARPDSRQPVPIVSAEGKIAAAEVLSKYNISGDYALIAPVSAYGGVKDWPADRYAEVARKLAEEMPVLITGSRGQAEQCNAIATAAGKEVTSIAGETGLAGFMGITSQAKLFLGGDSGGAHLAAGFGIQTTVIYGITEPSRTKQLGPAVTILGKGGLCTPDLKDPGVQAMAKQALEEIGVDEVMGTIRGKRHIVSQLTE